MAVIDVQVHAYERNHPGRPWAGHLHGPASATGEEMLAAMDAVGVDAAIIVLYLQPLPLRPELCARGLCQVSEAIPGC